RASLITPIERGRFYRRAPRLTLGSRIDGERGRARIVVHRQSASWWILDGNCDLTKDSKTGERSAAVAGGYFCDDVSAGNIKAINIAVIQIGAPERSTIRIQISGEETLFQINSVSLNYCYPAICILVQTDNLITVSDDHVTAWSNS